MKIGNLLGLAMLVAMMNSARADLDTQLALKTRIEKMIHIKASELLESELSGQDYKVVETVEILENSPERAPAVENWLAKDPQDLTTGWVDAQTIANGDPAKTMSSHEIGDIMLTVYMAEQTPAKRASVNKAISEMITKGFGIAPRISFRSLDKPAVEPEPARTVASEPPAPQTLWEKHFDQILWLVAIALVVVGVLLSIITLRRVPSVNGATPNKTAEKDQATNEQKPQAQASLPAKEVDPPVAAAPAITEKLLYRSFKTETLASRLKQLDRGVAKMLCKKWAAGGESEVKKALLFLDIWIEHRRSEPVPLTPSHQLMKSLGEVNMLTTEECQALMHQMLFEITAAENFGTIAFDDPVEELRSKNTQFWLDLIYKNKRNAALNPLLLSLEQGPLQEVLTLLSQEDRVFMMNSMISYSKPITPTILRESLESLKNEIISAASSSGSEYGSISNNSIRKKVFKSLGTRGELEFFGKTFDRKHELFSWLSANHVTINFFPIFKDEAILKYLAGAEESELVDVLMAIDSAEFEARVLNALPSLQKSILESTLANQKEAGVRVDWARLDKFMDKTREAIEAEKVDVESLLMPVAEGDSEPDLGGQSESEAA